MQNPAPDPFRTRLHVTDFDAYPLAYAARSRATRERLESHLDVPYGESAAERLDIFLPAGRSGLVPVHLFVHGGYWRMFSKSDYSFIADTVVAAGAIAVVIDYGLMPAVRLDRIVAQVRRALAWVVRHAAEYGADADRVTISGHSAGAHLCSYLFDDSQGSVVRSALLLGGIYDLAPLQHSFLADEIALTDDEVRRWSPLNAAFKPGPAVVIAVGDAETIPFHEQASAFGRHLSAQGLEIRTVVLPASNHMSSVRDLGAAKSSIGAILTDMI